MGRPDVVIFCEGPPDASHGRLPLQRYKFKVDQGTWVQTIDADTSEVMIYPDGSVVGHADGPPPERRRWLHHCDVCGDNLPVTYGRMVFLLAWATAVGYSEFSLRGVRARLDELDRGAVLDGVYPPPGVSRLPRSDSC
jgi:hypothetical protein